MISRRTGFTLIELLVVIAIIAILAAILFPVFATAKKAGQKAVCQGNVKQMLQASQMYEDDFGGILPGCSDLDGSGASWSGAQEMDELWPALIDKYIRQLKVKQNGSDSNFELRGVFMCPSALPVIPANASARATFTAEQAHAMARCYGYNYKYLGGDPGNATKAKFYKPADVVKPTRTIRILENWNFGSSNYLRGCGSIMAYPPVALGASPNGVWPPGWHNGASTVGWFDGHVSVVKLTEPRPGGKGAEESDYTGIMQKYFNNDSSKAAFADPYFNISGPKP